MYSLGLATLNANQFGPVRDKLAAKTVSAGHDPRIAEQLQNRRTFTLKYPVASEESADFLLILAKDSKSNQINLVSGDESLRKAIPMITGRRARQAPAHYIQC